MSTKTGDLLRENPAGDTQLRDKPDCFHCGEVVETDKYVEEEKSFCCNGCHMAYHLIQSAGLDFYYDDAKNPLLERKKIDLEEGKFAYLDNEDIAAKIIRYEEGSIKQVWLDLPSIHCASCLRVLENLHRFDRGVIKVSVNFEKKTAHVLFDSDKISLRKLVFLLASIGYEPSLTLEEITEKNDRRTNMSLIYKLGVAGFCFGNIMLLSLPDYFAGSREIEANLDEWFKYLSLILSLPVFFYSSQAFFKPAIAGLKQNYVNMDFPVALAILATFVRSVVDVLFGFGTGFFDSMSGIVFFMLVGRYLQSRTHTSLSFDRDFRSYFPIAIDTLVKDQFLPKALPDLEKGDIIRIRPGEIIPGDGRILDGDGHIDYSFVTGESAIIKVNKGEKVFSGGRQTRNLLTVQLSSKVAQSYLTSLWNKDAFKKKSQKRMEKFDRWGRDFTWGVIAIAVIAAIVWLFIDPYKSMDAFTAVLIIACPCALLVTVAYTHGHLLNVLSRNEFYLRDSGVLSTLAHPDAIVWDKTGTLTSQKKFTATFVGTDISDIEKIAVASVTSLSLHPLSQIITEHLKSRQQLDVRGYEEIAGKGITANAGDIQIKAGSSQFILGKAEEKSKNGSRVHIEINGQYRGYFELIHLYRNRILETVSGLSGKTPNIVLSGDNDAEKAYLQEVLGEKVDLKFEQLPADKLEYLKKIKEEGKKAIMIGDGLNDAGALQQSELGLAVSDQLNNFTPASDGIIKGDQLHRLPDFMKLASWGQRLIAGVFTYSAIYNIAGIWFAVRAELSPMIAAIIMPLSSISIILITFTGVYIFSKKLGL
ncbi:MAG: HAD family hydrolase [Saprospirales bacterium]|nr:MAG: HAD family hydrolase [Saprospirales bacterium]